MTFHNSNFSSGDDNSVTPYLYSWHAVAFPTYKLHKDQSERRNFADVPGRGMVASVRYLLCLQRKRTRNGSCFFPPLCWCSRLQLYRVMQATAHLCCSVVLLKFIPAQNLICEELSSCFLIKIVVKVFCMAVSLTSVSSVYIHLPFSMWHPRDPCQKEILYRSWHIVSRKNNTKYFPVPVCVYTVPSTSPLRFGCYIKEG